jgi:hypothetical protein
MNPKKKLQKHHLTEDDTKWLFDNYNPERDGYNGWLLEIPRDEQVVVLSVACERPTLQLESYDYPSNTSMWAMPRTTIPEIYFEVRQQVTDGLMSIVRDFGSTSFESERRGRAMGYKKNMTLTRYIHGTVSEKYHLIGCMMTNVTFLTNTDDDQTVSFTLSCDHFTLVT